MQTAMNLKTAAMALMVGTFILTGAAISQAAKLSAQDKEFITTAAQGGIAEVKMGQVATEQAQSGEVQEFAQHVVKDHKAANEQLMEVASELGVQPPKATDKEHQQLLSQLSGLSGAKFDQRYVSEQIKGHKEMISLFKQQIK